jgi:hypothetical protein
MLMKRRPNSPSRPLRVALPFHAAVPVLFPYLPRYCIYATISKSGASSLKWRSFFSSVAAGRFDTLSSTALWKSLNLSVEAYRCSAIIRVYVYHPDEVWTNTYLSGCFAHVTGGPLTHSYPPTPCRRQSAGQRRA